MVNFDKNTKNARNKRVYAILKKTGRELWNKHLKKVKAELEAEKENKGEKMRQSMKKRFLPAMLKSIKNKGETKS